jgi:ABC-type glycerol-3-phosphate transport system substrate-binding protein
MFHSNKLLLTEVGLGSFRNFNSTEQEQFGEPVAFIPFPNSSGNEGGILYEDKAFAIASQSKNKEAAFKFIMLFMDEEYQMPGETEYYAYGFPSLKAAFDQAGEYSKERTYWIDFETGKKEYYDETYYDEKTGKEIVIKPISDDRLAYIKDRIIACKTLRSFDQEIINLVNEEAAPYFAGEKSAQEVANIIQSRVSIYVRENQ